MGQEEVSSCPSPSREHAAPLDSRIHPQARAHPARPARRGDSAHDRDAGIALGSHRVDHRQRALRKEYAACYATFEVFFNAKLMQANEYSSIPQDTSESFQIFSDMFGDEGFHFFSVPLTNFP